MLTPAFLPAVVKVPNPTLPESMKESPTVIRLVAVATPVITAPGVADTNVWAVTLVDGIRPSARTLTLIVESVVPIISRG